MKRLFTVLLIAAVLPAAAFAQAGRFTEIQGRVSVERADGGETPAGLGTQVFQGDVVRTARNGRATLLFEDGSVMNLGPGTVLRVSKLVYDEQRGIAQAAYDLAVGTIMSVVGSLFGSREQASYTINSPTMVSGVRGTTFVVKVEQDPAGGYITTVAGVDGQVFVQGRTSGEFELGPGEYSTAGPDGDAAPPLPMSPGEIEELVNSTRPGKRSLPLRAGQLRKESGTKAPLWRGGAFIPPVLLVTGRPSSSDADPECLAAARDNPADLIYQESPLFTEIEISVGIP